MGLGVSAIYGFSFLRTSFSLRFQLGNESFFTATTLLQLLLHHNVVFCPVEALVGHVYMYTTKTFRARSPRPAWGPFFLVSLGVSLAPTLIGPYGALLVARVRVRAKITMAYMTANLRKRVKVFFLRMTIESY